jgi:hypothetical protein
MRMNFSYLEKFQDNQPKMQKKIKWLIQNLYYVKMEFNQHLP